MPFAPKRPCAQPGCPALVDGRYCVQHQRTVARRYDDRRGSSTARGYDRRWRKARDVYLADNPLCIDCLEQGRSVPATVVDHAIPHRGDDALFWDEGNWAARCKPHHDRKTARQDSGFGNPRR